MKLGARRRTRRDLAVDEAAVGVIDVEGGDVALVEDFFARARNSTLLLHQPFAMKNAPPSEVSLPRQMSSLTLALFGIEVRKSEEVGFLRLLQPDPDGGERRDVLDVVVPAAGRAFL